jgi:hypothetical protein
LTVVAVSGSGMGLGLRRFGGLVMGCRRDGGAGEYETEVRAMTGAGKLWRRWSGRGRGRGRGGMIGGTTLDAERPPRAWRRRLGVAVGDLKRQLVRGRLSLCLRAGRIEGTGGLE